MNEFRMSLLKTRADAIRPDLAEARQTLEKAEREKREMTDEEQAFVEPILKSAREIADSMKAVRDEDTLMTTIKTEFGDVMGGIGGSSPRPSHVDFPSRAWAPRSPPRWLASSARRPWLPVVLRVGQEFKPDPVALGKPATALLDVLPVVGHSSPEFSYLRQTTRQNLAAVVAEGATKPTSQYSVTRIEASLVVVAHLSEAVPRFWLLDNVSLDRFVEAELEYGLGLAVETKVLADINGTSGIQTQAYTTSVLATIRKALTKLEVAGYSPASIVLHPTDFEGVELALSTVTAIEHLSLPFDAASRRLFGTPIVSTNSQAAGVAHCWPPTRWHSTPTPRAWASSGASRATPPTSHRT